MAAGAIAILAGGTFTLQGLDLIGPPSSFMVGNRSWIAYGLAVAAVGIAAVYTGFSIRRAKESE